MQKDANYHESAIRYNEELAAFAEDLSERLKHEVIKQWSRAVAKQHRFHAGRHKKALIKMLAEDQEDTVARTEDPDPTPEQVANATTSIQDEQKDDVIEAGAEEKY